MNRTNKVPLRQRRPAWSTSGARNSHMMPTIDRRRQLERAAPERRRTSPPGIQTPRNTRGHPRRVSAAELPLVRSGRSSLNGRAIIMRRVHRIVDHQPLIDVDIVTAHRRTPSPGSMHGHRSQLSASVTSSALSPSPQPREAMLLGDDIASQRIHASRSRCPSREQASPRTMHVGAELQSRDSRSSSNQPWRIACVDSGVYLRSGA